MNLKECLRERRIFNTHDLIKAYAADTGRTGVYVSYAGRMNERSPIGPRWHVIRPRFKTDLNAAWYDAGCKAFPIDGREAYRTQRVAAIDWAAQWYGYPAEDWKPSPMNGRESVPGPVLDWAKAWARKVSRT